MKQAVDIVVSRSTELKLIDEKQVSCIKHNIPYGSYLC
jgi:hypothetical protein